MEEKSTPSVASLRRRSRSHQSSSSHKVSMTPPTLSGTTPDELGEFSRGTWANTSKTWDANGRTSEVSKYVGEDTRRGKHFCVFGNYTFLRHLPSVSNVSLSSLWQDKKQGKKKLRRSVSLSHITPKEKFEERSKRGELVTTPEDLGTFAGSTVSSRSRAWMGTGSSTEVIAEHPST